MDLQGLCIDIGGVVTMEFLQEPSKEDLLYWSLLNPPPLEKPALATEGPMADTTIHEHTQSEEWIQGLERQRMAIRIMAKIRTFAIFGHGTSTPRWCPLCFTFDLTSRFFPSCRTQVRMTPWCSDGHVSRCVSSRAFVCVCLRLCVHWCALVCIGVLVWTHC